MRKTSRQGGIFTERPNISLGLLAHVDAGKTTLSEALLYQSGARRSLGRVDHRDAYLDTHALERARGITIFSKQAHICTESLDITLVDTPGHVDFSAEAERTLPILDSAILVISGTDGVQAHTLTLWQLLRRYQIPTVLFINKMDLPGTDREKILAQLQKELSPGCVDFGEQDKLYEGAAMCDEQLLEQFLESGSITAEDIRVQIGQGKLFPCIFGAALHLQEIDKLLVTLDTYLPRPQWGAEFGARVYKISRDAQGNRLTWLKVTGGKLPVRSSVCYVNQKGEKAEEKVIQLRLYSGDKFTPADVLLPGQLAAVTGLTATYAGQGLGVEESDAVPTLEPVMTYRVNLMSGTDPALVMPQLRLLEEEDPMLRLVWENGSIFIQIMGKVQLEVFRSLVKERFHLDVTLDTGRIFYKETISNTVEGVGHFEPLRHYAEVHLILEPLPLGSGLVFDTVCSTDLLDINYQRLIMGHLSEKTHRGVLTGAPITDMKITLAAGCAHLKHTEGGDFRQATYRAIRQGLMQAKSVLLEPWYSFVLTVPTPQIGRAITDIRAMGGEFDAPENSGELSILRGILPASELGDYPEQVAAYTQGTGRLQITLDGYKPCHNTEAVIAALSYDPEADLENTPDSVFCAHGAGFTVKWNEIADYMHLENCLKQPKEPQVIQRNLALEDRELEEIMRREFGEVSTTLYRPRPRTDDGDKRSIKPLKQQYLIVDGYNIIFAWEDLAAVAKEDLENARRQLCDRLSDFAGFRKWRVVVVFDGYKVKGNPGEKLQHHNIQVVYTKENETGDNYIESLVAQVGTNYNLRVATSDSLVQLGALRSGVLRMSARELQEELLRAKEEMKKHY
ncbi:MAG: GTP-binding protein [Ruminococcaceae bacterium]|nr:GTP-binding protein [Oscillospiraceae bacterium]